MQATRNNTPEFLTTTRQLTNKERLWRWERRKQARKDIQSDDQRYIAVLVAFAILGAVAAISLALVIEPDGCVWVWNHNGINKWCGE